MEVIKYQRREPNSTYAGAEVLLTVDDDGFYTVQILCLINDEDVEVMYERSFTSEADAADLYAEKATVLDLLLV